MRWNSFVSDYLSFSKKDRIALYALLVLVACCYLFPFFLKSGTGVAIVDDSLYYKPEDSKLAASAGDPRFAEEKETFNTSPSFKNGNRFFFDPNHLPADGWAKLGLPSRSIKTLLNYRNKGGRFYRKEDLQKVWGLPEGFYAWVADYIRIGQKQETKHHALTKPRPDGRERPVTLIEINSADTSAWIALPGIGPRLAQRVVAFRSRLGGFYSVEQVGETYGLPDSTFQKLRHRLQVQPDQVKRININTATKEELKVHPYIRWSLANAIVAYRNQHGPFKALEELKQIVLVDEALFDRLRNYLTVE